MPTALKYVGNKGRQVSLDNIAPHYLYSVEQTRQLDRLAIHQFGIAGIELMRRAGSACFEIVQQQWHSSRHLTVFCGAGNNAGDGYVIARLALAKAWTVTVYSLIEPGKLKHDAKTAFEDFAAAGVDVLQFHPDIELTDTLVVDALLGTGLDRAVTGDFKTAVNLINRAQCPVVAVDIPSGLQGDSGSVMGCAVKADVTVTFIARKAGLFTADAAEYCGRIYYASLNIPHAVFDGVTPFARLIAPPALAARARTSHKGQHGHVLLIGGDCGYMGAIRLAAEAALRTGAGLVSVATRADHSHLINAGRFEIMSHGVEQAEELTPLLEKATVIVIGPGLGLSDWAKSLWQQARLSGRPMVVDADALNLLSQNPHQNNNWILTPHPGEAARLLATDTNTIQHNRFEAASRLFQRYAGVCVLKGAGSLIASEHGVAVNTTGNPGMASGGMGDVLAGMIGALLGQGLSLIDAAETAVYTHGLAADRAAQEGGERGLLAGDLLPHIRALLN